MAQDSRPFGALSRGVGELDDAGYELKSPEGKIPVIFERLTPEKLLVRKTWTPVTEGAGKGFLWRLSIDFKNQGAAAFAGTYSLYAGTATPIQKTDEAVSVCWNADGAASHEDVGWFEGSGFLGMKFRQPSPTLQRDFQQLLWAGVHSQYYTTLIANTQAERDLPPGSVWAEPKPFTLEEAGAHYPGEGDLGRNRPATAQARPRGGKNGSPLRSIWDHGLTASSRSSIAASAT